MQQFIQEKINDQFMLTTYPDDGHFNLKLNQNIHHHTNCILIKGVWFPFREAVITGMIIDVISNDEGGLCDITIRDPRNIKKRKNHYIATFRMRETNFVSDVYVDCTVNISLKVQCYTDDAERTLGISFTGSYKDVKK